MIIDRSFFFLYDKLREEFFLDLGIGSQPEEHFLEGVRPAYRQCLEIIRNPVNDYLFDRCAGATASGTDELAEIKASSSYRIGKAVTWLPRTAKKGVRAIRSCGLGYTLKMAWRTLTRGGSRE